jgi:hypothetical protein
VTINCSIRKKNTIQIKKSSNFDHSKKDFFIVQNMKIQNFNKRCVCLSCIELKTYCHFSLQGDFVETKRPWRDTFLIERG